MHGPCGANIYHYGFWAVLKIKWHWSGHSSVQFSSVQFSSVQDGIYPSAQESPSLCAPPCLRSFSNVALETVCLINGPMLSRWSRSLNVCLNDNGPIKSCKSRSSNACLIDNGPILSRWSRSLNACLIDIGPILSHWSRSLNVCLIDNGPILSR